MKSSFYGNRLAKLEKLQPIENQTQVDKIEARLRDFFRQGNFQPGDSIPKELELAEALGVSRTSVREALSRFKTLGIIESRKNRGMIINHSDLLHNMQKIVDLKLLDNAKWKEIFELRLVLEIGTADLLFLRKTDADIKKLEEIVLKEEQSVNKNEHKKYDVEFHSMLYKISGNDFIQRFQKMLFPFFNFDDNSLNVETVPADSNVSHRDLLNTLKEGTPEEFSNKMRLHLKEYFDKL